MWSHLQLIFNSSKIGYMVYYLLFNLTLNLKYYKTIFICWISPILKHGHIWANFTSHIKFIYEGRLFVCFSHWDLPNPNTISLVFGIVGKPSMGTSAPSWFHNVSTYIGKLLNIEQIFTKFSFKSKQKNLGKFLLTFHIVGKPLMDRI
jgi:hypothetical protein